MRFTVNVIHLLVFYHSVYCLEQNEDIIVHRNTRLSNVEDFKHTNIPPKPVSHSNFAHVFLMIAHILPTMI